MQPAVVNQRMHQPRANALPAVCGLDIHAPQLNDTAYILRADRANWFISQPGQPETAASAAIDRVDVIQVPFVFIIFRQTGDGGNLVFAEEDAMFSQLGKAELPERKPMVRHVFLNSDGVHGASLRAYLCSLYALMILLAHSGPNTSAQ